MSDLYCFFSTHIAYFGFEKISLENKLDFVCGHRMKSLALFLFKKRKTKEQYCIKDQGADC